MRRAFVPLSVLTDTEKLGAEALRLLLVVAAHADKQRRSYVSNDTIGEMLKIKSRNVQKLMKSVIDAGYLKRQYDPDSGRRYLHVIFDDLGGERSVHPAHSECAPVRTDSTGGGALPVQGVAHSECASPTPPIYEEQLSLTVISNSGGSGGAPEESKPTQNATTTTTKNLEPFEAGIGSEIPAIRNAVEPFRPRLVELRPTEFKPETRDRIMSVLGHDAEQFARKITQEQADAGFPDWILDEAKRNKTPGRLAFHLLKTAWRPGWINPKAEEEAKRAARRARIEAL